MLPKTAKDTKDSQSRLDFFLMMNLLARLQHNWTLKKPNLYLSVIAMALDITDYLPDIFEYLCETAHLHLVHCIPRLMSSKATPKAHASWTDTDNTQLISFLYEHWAQGTDGRYKKSTYIAAAEDLAPHHHKGEEKNWKSCKPNNGQR